MTDASGDAAAWREFAATRDATLRDQLIEAHLELARTVAATLYRQRGSLDVEFGDYLQFATLGLIEAVDRFDPMRGVSFASFASIRIRGAVLNSLEGLSEQYQQIDLRRRLRQERFESLRRPQGVPHLASQDLFARLAEMAVGLALSHLLEGSGMLQAEGGEAQSYHQQFYDTARERQLRETLERLVKGLPDRERRVIRYHYFQNIGFAEIAQMMGVTKGRVSQIHRNALLSLRQAQPGGAPLSREM